MKRNRERGHASASAEAMQYALRSSFYYRQAAEFARLARKMESAARRAKCAWEPLTDLGITEAAWQRVSKCGIQPQLVFAHPAVVGQASELIEYYRSIAALPQKGLTRLLRHVSPPVHRTSADALVMTCRVINSHLSVVIESEPRFSLDLAPLAAHMNYRAQMNGSWRNRIGAEGSARVKELVIGHFDESGPVRGKILKGGIAETPGVGAAEVERVELTNGYVIIFGSEPDISLRNPAGVLEVAIEVKAGLDPAGAMERYGACKKSFDRALDENKSATTLYLASCTTPAVERAIARDRLVTRSFDLGAILTQPEARADFLAHLRWLVHL